MWLKGELCPSVEGKPACPFRIPCHTLDSHYLDAFHHNKQQHSDILKQRATVICVAGHTLTLYCCWWMQHKLSGCENINRSVHVFAGAKAS